MTTPENKEWFSNTNNGPTQFPPVTAPPITMPNPSKMFKNSRVGNSWHFKFFKFFKRIKNYKKLKQN